DGGKGRAGVRRIHGTGARKELEVEVVDAAALHAETPDDVHHGRGPTTVDGRVVRSSLELRHDVVQAADRAVAVHMYVMEGAQILQPWREGEILRGTAKVDQSSAPALVAKLLQHRKQGRDAD